MPRPVDLPTFHDGQVAIWNEKTQRNSIRCGRRFGKTKMIVTLASDAAARGKKVGIFAPTYKQLSEPYVEIQETLANVISSSNKTEGVIRTTENGKIDFWSLIDNELAGRGREYDDVLIDEAAFTKNTQMLDIWNKSIVPTMATKPGARVWVFSTPNGVDTENFFWRCGNDPEMGFKEFHAPSWSNPLVNKQWIEDERKRMHPDVFRQEILAEWVDWSGVAFFNLEKWLVDGNPVAYPTNCDRVFAVIDSAVKTGSDNDGTAVIYLARNQWAGTPLIILDYDIVQIEADLLNSWLPNVVLPRLDELSRQVGAREGVRGIWVEDKASGSVLLQHGGRKGWPLIPIDSAFTALGKDERAIAVSSHHHQALCKISDFAYNKTVNYKGMTRNHLMSQVTGFRIGDKDAARRADDLLDVYVYGLALSLGSTHGF
jgi:hypothetical protein